MKLISILRFVAFVYASEEEEPSDVVVLTNDSIDAFIEETPLSLIEFYAPWCGHCKQLKPEYEKAATQLKDKLPIAKVDCTVEKDACSKFSIQGFPTLKIFRDGTPTEYNGHRTAESIVQIMTRQLMPAVSDLDTPKDVFKFVEASKVVVIGFFSESDAKEIKKFKGVAEALRDDYVFGQTHNQDSAKAAKVEQPAVVLYKKFDEKKIIYDGQMTKVALTEFIQKNSVPTMDDLGPSNYEKYVSMGLPMAYFFHHNTEQKEEFGPMFEKIAKDYKGKILFVYLDASQYGSHAENLALKQTWPAFGILTPKPQSKYPFDQTKTLNEKDISEFVKAFANGELKPTMKSDDIPETNDGPVTVVVGKQFKEIVMDASKDVLVEFYAPWCGHCKKLAPIYEELGKKVNSPTTVIAKLDATTNDTPDVNVQGFPTIILFKRGTNEQVTFNGDRSVEGFLKFFEEQGVEVGVVEDDDEHIEL